MTTPDPRRGPILGIRNALIPAVVLWLAILALVVLVLA